MDIDVYSNEDELCTFSLRLHNNSFSQRVFILNYVANKPFNKITSFKINKMSDRNSFFSAISRKNIEQNFVISCFFH